MQEDDDRELFIRSLSAEEKKEYGTMEEDDRNERWPFRKEYDIVIRSFGFIFDVSPLLSGGLPVKKHERHSKFPKMNEHYESDIPNLYFAGALAHIRDFKRSAGGFIHGYRYTVRALFRHLEEKKGREWPHHIVKDQEMVQMFLTRINEASGIYQVLVVVLCVVVVVVVVVVVCMVLLLLCVCCVYAVYL